MKSAPIALSLVALGLYGRAQAQEPSGRIDLDVVSGLPGAGAVIFRVGDLPTPMKEAIEQFRTRLGAAIDSVEFVKRALDRQLHESERGEGPA